MFYFDPDFYFFNRPVKDMSPYKLIEKDGKNVLVLNTLGISEKDIAVDVEKGRLPNEELVKVSGKTKDDLTGNEYSINMQFKFENPIKEIEWESKNGLTYLYVNYAEPVKPQVKITKR